MAILRGSKKYPYPQGRGKFQKPKFLKESVTQTWNFPIDGEGVAQSKNPLWVGYGHFLEHHIRRLLHLPTKGGGEGVKVKRDTEVQMKLWVRSLEYTETSTTFPNPSW